MNKRKKTVLKKHRRKQRKMKEKQKAFTEAKKTPKEKESKAETTPPE